MIKPLLDMSQLDTKEFVEEQMRLRMELIENPAFREMCVEYVKSVGMTADEWNENRASMLMILANEAIGYGQKEGLI